MLKFRGGEGLVDEAVILEYLRGDYIVKILDSHLCGNHPFIALEFMDGGELIDQLRRKLIGIPTALRLFHILAQAVYHLHEKGIVHLDLRPHNILLSQKLSSVLNGEESQPDALRSALAGLKLIDFGLSRALPECPIQNISEYRANFDIGTPYAPDDQYDMRDPTTAMDVFALGRIGHDLVYGISPTWNVNYRWNMDPDRTRFEIDTALNDRLDSLLEQMQHEEPSSRPGIDFVVEELEKLF